MTRSTEDFRGLLKAARRAGTPLLAVRTADPASAMAQVSASLCGKTEVPVFAWDIMGGIAARNEAAKDATAHVFGEKAVIAVAVVVGAQQRPEQAALDKALHLADLYN